MHEDVRWLLGVIIIFGLIWFVSGSLNKSSTTPLLPASNAGTGEFSHVGGNTAGSATQNQNSGNESERRLTTTEEISKSLTEAGLKAAQIKKELEILEEASHVSPLQGKIKIANIRTSSANADGEYVLLKAATSNKEKILISGLRFQSEVTGRVSNIKNGAYLPFQNSINKEEPIYLNPGDVAYVITGPSPLGISFRLNTCTGFYTQYQNFNPSLPSRCPAPRNEPIPAYLSSNDQCLDYIYSLPGCRVITPPKTIPNECASFVVEEFNYTKCVDRHKNESNFYSPDWRIYLNRSEPLWKTRREFIKLLDQNGKVVDTITY